MANEYSIRSPRYLFFFLFIEKIFLILKGLLNYLKIIKFFITHYFFSKLSKKKKEEKIKGDIFLFHDLINSSEFKDKPTQSRYFGAFPYWLLENKKKRWFPCLGFIKILKIKKNYIKI